MGCHSEPIKTDQHRGVRPSKSTEEQIWTYAAGQWSRFVLLVCVLSGGRGPELHGHPERSPVNRGRGREGEVEEHVWDRERVGWFDLVVGGSPLYPGFPAAGWGERLVSSGAAEKCQSTQRDDLRSYGNKTNSEWAEASYSSHTIKKTQESTRGILTRGK